MRMCCKSANASIRRGEFRTISRRSNQQTCAFWRINLDWRRSRHLCSCEIFAGGETNRHSVFGVSAFELRSTQRTVFAGQKKMEEQHGIDFLKIGRDCTLTCLVRTWFLFRSDEQTCADRMSFMRTLRKPPWRCEIEVRRTNYL